MDLAAWQDRLERHFGELFRRRSSEAPGQPTFGLEHGLTSDEIASVSEGMREEIRETHPQWTHRLPWLVYASEFGYLYAGDEYWQTFEEKTPYWSRNGDRYWIRLCFQDFHENFGGAKPTGPWASHFSIICWPITHAILPCDLQRQLARLLYELRHALSPETLGSPQKLGEAIAARAWRSSSRFQQLAQEPLFIGQIAAALLTEDQGAASSLIHSATIKRISSDLDRERISRSWMRGAREGVQRRVRFGAIRGQYSSGDVGWEQEQQASEARPSLEPRLFLRRSGQASWEVAVELPDLSHLLKDSSELRELLTTSRCVVWGSSGRPLARGRLLYGPQTVVLKEWPPSGTPLLQFEDSPTGFEYLLRGECALRPGPKWVFKVASDGMAYELKCAQVRPCQRYVVLVEDGFSSCTNSPLTPLTLTCKGVRAFELDIPDTISRELSDSLIAFGIRQAGTLQLWPAGLPPIRWDGEGGVEWLTTDKPFIGLCVDHPVDVVKLQLNEHMLSVERLAPGEPLFVQLPQLSPGRHSLNVSSVRLVDGRAEEEFDSLSIDIREPRAWAPGTNAAAAFFVIAEPPTANLEQLWEGEVSFEVYGPTAQMVASEVSLFDRTSETKLVSKRLPSLRPPIDATTWRKHFDRHFREPREVHNAYDLAYLGRVHMEAGELGQFTYETEREFTPLRWAARRSSGGVALRLVDDSGADRHAEISHYEFDTPDVANRLAPNGADGAIGSWASPGLYTANTAEYSCGVLVPPEIHTFADLRIHPRLAARQRTQVDIRSLAEVAERWASARVMGSQLSFYLRRTIMARLVHGLFELLAGRQWSRVESAIHANTNQPILDVLGAQHKRADEIELARKLSALARDLVEATPRERVRVFAGLANEHFDLRDTNGASSSKDISASIEWLSEFAVRLACCAKKTISWAGKDADLAIAKLLETPSITRSARLMVLILSSEQAVSEQTTGLYEGWVW